MMQVQICLTYILDADVQTAGEAAKAAQKWASDLDGYAHPEDWREGVKKAAVEAVEVMDVWEDLPDCEETEARESCPSCGADIGLSTVYPWHDEDEDCRAVREPLNEEG